MRDEFEVDGGKQVKNNITEFIKLGKIPNDSDMTNDLFKQYWDFSRNK